VVCLWPELGLDSGQFSRSRRSVYKPTTSGDCAELFLHKTPGDTRNAGRLNLELGGQ